MEVNAASGSGSDVKVVDPDEIGFAGLTADHFMTLLITELQNQDPTNPVGNEEILNQLAMMQNLSSNIELADTLESMTTNQQLSSAASYIGKFVIGEDIEERMIQGVVDRAFIADGVPYVGVGGTSVQLDKIVSIHQASEDASDDSGDAVDSGDGGGPSADGS